MCFFLPFSSDLEPDNSFRFTEALEGSGDTVTLIDMEAPGFSHILIPTRHLANSPTPKLRPGCCQKTEATMQPEDGPFASFWPQIDP